MSEERPQGRSPAEEEIERQTMRVVRHTGYVVFFGATLLLCIPMIIAGVRGLQQDRVWDPMTGEPVSRAHTELTCLDDAQQLIFTVGQRGEWTGATEQRYRLWLARCRTDYPQAYDMLSTTRTSLRVQSPGQDEAGEGVGAQ